MQSMTPRERVKTALSRRPPDRVPKGASFTPALLKVVKEKIGGQEPADYFGFETRSVGSNPPREKPDFSRYLPPDLLPGTTSDEWDLTETPGEYYHFTEYVYPMAELNDPKELDDWPFPDHTPAYRFEGLPERVAALHDQGCFPKRFIETIIAEQADLLGLSCLVTTTMLNMRGTVEALVEAGVPNRVKVIVGGALVTQQCADEIGADGYAPDAASAVDLARKLLGSKEG